MIEKQVVICKNPRMAGQIQFWKQIKSLIDDGWDFLLDGVSVAEAPVMAGWTKVTMFREIEEKEVIVEKEIISKIETEETPKPKKVGRPKKAKKK